MKLSVTCGECGEAVRSSPIGGRSVLCPNHGITEDVEGFFEITSVEIVLWGAAIILLGVLLVVGL